MHLKQHSTSFSRRGPEVGKKQRRAVRIHGRIQRPQSGCKHVFSMVCQACVATVGNSHAIKSQGVPVMLLGYGFSRLRWTA